MAYTTIKKASNYFDTNLYTANGTGKTISGMNFQPDFVWTKNRDNGSYIPALVDSVRGGTKKLFSNNTDAEATDAQSITSFNSDGYTFGSSGSFNFGTDNYVNWCWLASNTTASNTDGSITSTVSANQTSGFSIVKYTGNSTGSSTIGHGLGAVPKMIITKRLDSGSQSWYVYHQAIGNTNELYLNATSTAWGATGAWGSTTPTSSVFTVGPDDNTNANGSPFIAYCFADVQGFSKIGSYTGNASTDGTFVYTGFKPAYVLTKASSDIKHWVCFDNKRANTFNPANERILVSDTGTGYQSDTRAIDFLSNGFKLRDNGTDSSSANDSGRTYIYACFAEEPLVGDNPATAR